MLQYIFVRTHSSINHDELGNSSEDIERKTLSNLYPVLAPKECPERNSLQVRENHPG
jgi:hypothetical protein